MDAVRFGDRVRQRAAELGLTQVELARRSGCSTSTISKLLGPHPRLPYRQTAIDLARALEWNIDATLLRLGYHPLSADEDAALSKMRVSPVELLDALLMAWVKLTADQQAELVKMARQMPRPKHTTRRLSEQVMMFETNPRVSSAGPNCSARGHG